MTTDYAPEAAAAAAASTGTGSVVMVVLVTRLVSSFVALNMPSYVLAIQKTCPKKLP